MADNRGGITFKVCCPDCKDEQSVTPKEIIFDVSKGSQAGTFMCESRQCAVDPMKKIEVNSDLEISTLVESDQVQVVPSTFDQWVDMINVALDVVDSSTKKIDASATTIPAVLHALTVLSGRSEPASLKAVGHLWYSAVTQSLIKSEKILDGIMGLPQGRPGGITRFLTILQNQARTSSNSSEIFTLFTGQKRQNSDHMGSSRTGTRRNQQLHHPSGLRTPSFRPQPPGIRAEESHSNHGLPPMPSVDHRKTSSQERKVS